MCFSAQSEGRTAATVWNWSGKTLSPGALLAVLYFSFVPYFSTCLDFPSPPLSAPGSPRMYTIDLIVVSEAILKGRQPLDKLQCFYGNLMSDKLQCFYGNLMSDNFRKAAVQKKKGIVKLSFTAKDCTNN